MEVDIEYFNFKYFTIAEIAEMAWVNKKLFE